MIRLATVHYATPRWIDLQRRYLERFAGGDFMVYGSLEGIDASYDARFDFVTRAPGSHAEKLNALAARIVEEARDDDTLVFLDGDAFPIAELAPWLEEALARRPLAAVRRDENLGDPQPHPCFCATTVRFWTGIRGDWSPGYTWRSSAGSTVSDVGGNLLGELTRQGIDWEPLLRTNARNLHPLWFGVYGGLVYHHGAGFRERLSRIDLATSERPPRIPVVRRVLFEWSKRRESRRRREVDRLSALVFARLTSEDDFCGDLFF